MVSWKTVVTVVIDYCEAAIKDKEMEYENRQQCIYRYIKI